MFEPDVRFEGFTARDWSLLGALFQPDPIGLDPAARALSGGIVAVTQGSRLCKLLHSERGRIPNAEAVTVQREGSGQIDLEALANAHSARWALAIHGGALGELTSRFAAKLEREDRLLRQLLLLVSVLKELESEGAFDLWPRRVAEWPVPTEGIVEKALDALCTPGKVALVGIFHAGGLETCVAARRSARGFDWVMGPDELRQDMGLLSGDFRRDYQHLVGAAENRLGPLGVGCFGERKTLRALIHEPTPGAWATAVAARDIIVSPIAPAIAIPLGLDVARAALTFVRALAGQLDKNEWFGMRAHLSPTVDKVSSFARSQVDLGSLIGFDPLTLLKTLLGPHPARPPANDEPET